MRLYILHSTLHSATLQYTTALLNTKRHSTVHSATLQYTASLLNTQRHSTTVHSATPQYTAPLYSTQRHSSIHRATLQYTAPLLNTQRHSTTVHSATLQYTTPLLNTQRHSHLSLYDMPFLHTTSPHPIPMTTATARSYDLREPYSFSLFTINISEGLATSHCNQRHQHRARYCEDAMGE